MNFALLFIPDASKRNSNRAFSLSVSRKSLNNGNKEENLKNQFYEPTQGTLSYNDHNILSLSA